MNLDRYDLTTGIHAKYYEFVSSGTHGDIVKVVTYTLFPNEENTYNLGFGDKDELTGQLNDNVITNNGDTDKVLATVAFTLYAFFDEYPTAIVYSTGLTTSRTRLYQININKFLNIIAQDFIVYGELEGGFERFQKNINYLGFAVKKR